ncbi:MAG: nicotinamide-nucleotide adenylyltransferase [Candidatus Peregrinibacteria bacterium GW2011_GWA2_33_10]|nr:MAG: nicotinamide-nucleotide adenylyltransferase [Candidatus Peregrinibacteria bacterium GW2011_GWA2_33_10]KKP40937.1 MAG: nicotinamide-nucleotide adenylyltransferase, nicotinamide-nucleotide adenylyltransferase [Candidatus Peregrinibacteria bacterium GW2011_GWC2_33_13]OGJ49585.1 MAG: hypothetical protein A2229_05305 [Candidatus Peregrinibacteria bacterium RIFOXYA2_FULL_33_7]
MSALFIGRFQPFHLGHLNVIKKAIKKEKYLIIGIGSALENFLPENPFTARERFQMIKNTLDTEKIPANKYCIIPIPNINQFALWVNHVEQLTPPFEKVYTGSELVKCLFQKSNNNYKIINIKKELKISATQVRESLLKNTDFWTKNLHPQVKTFLKKIDAQNRLKDINAVIPFV